MVGIWTFGLPNNSFEDNGHRGLRSCLDVASALLALGLTTHTGITSGTAFCGLVGAAYRCEYLPCLPWLLTTHSPLLTAHYSLPTTHYSLLTTHYPLLTTHYPLLTTHYSLVTAHYPLPTTHYPLLSTQYPLPTTQYSILSTHQV